MKSECLKTACQDITDVGMSGTEARATPEVGNFKKKLKLSWKDDDEWKLLESDNKESTISQENIVHQQSPLENW